MFTKSNNIGVRMKKERIDLGLRQIDVAFFLDASESMISHLEKEQKNNVFLNYLYFLRFNGIDLNELFDDDYLEKLTEYFEKKKQEIIEMKNTK